MHRVTDAQPSLTADIRRRERRYLIQMGLRVVCLILAVVLDVPWPIRALLVIGAIFLPYIAVVGANAGREPPGNTSGDGTDLTKNGDTQGKDAPDQQGKSDPEANQNEIPRHRREIGS